MLKFLRRIFGLFSSKKEAPSATKDESNWCFIPAGTVMIHGARGSYVRASKSESYAVDEFSIAKYPVTNAEFERFIAADGYNLKEFWTKEGWHYRQQEGWSQPKFWDDPHFNQANQPVVGVTWYEAMAYCEWLDYSVDERGVVPLDLRITLPTEQQWQLAAQNDEDTLYPWGHQFLQANANTKEANIGHTTARYQLCSCSQCQGCRGYGWQCLRMDTYRLDEWFR